MLSPECVDVQLWLQPKQTIPNRALEKQTVAKKEITGIPKESFLDLFLTLLVIAKTDNAKRVIDR